MAKGRAKKLVVVADDDRHELLDWTLEQGVSGTTNWSGEPMSEANALLRGTAGYGAAGSYAWGEWDRIRYTDPDIATVLEFIAAPIRDAEIHVEPTEDDRVPAAVAEAQALFVRDQLRSFSPGWYEFSTQAVKTALSVGFALHEVVLAVGDHPSLPGGKGYLLGRLAERLPVSVHPTNGWIEKDLEDGGRDLSSVRQLGQTGAGGGYSSTVEIPAEKLLLHTWQRSGLNYRGMSAFRPVWYIAKVREQLLKLVAIASIREGAGVPVAQSSEAADTLTPSQQRKLARALQNLVGHEHASMVMPRGWSIEWVFSPGANKGHLLETYNALGQLILRQLGAQQIALGTGETGSRSVGEVHDAVAGQYVQSVVRMLEDVLNGQPGRPYTGLARKLVDANWGEQLSYPKLTVSLKRRKIGIQEKLEAISMARAAGVLSATKDVEGLVREELGLTPLEEAEELEDDTEESSEQEEDDTEESSEPDAEPKKEASRCSCRKVRLAAGPRVPWAGPWRELSRAESRVDFAAVDNTIAQAREDFETALRPVVEAMVLDASPAVAKALKSGDPAALLDLELNTADLEKSVGAWLASLRSQGKRDVAKELKSPEAAEKTVEERAGPVQLARAAEVADEARFAVLEAQKRSVVKRIVGRLQAWISREAVEEVRQGTLDAGAVVKDVLEVLDESAALRADAGSAVARAYNVGREEAAELMGATQAQYSAILDSNVCQACLAEDGRVYELDSDEYEKALPPNRECEGGDNCRCVMVYIPGEGAP